MRWKWKQCRRDRTSKPEHVRRERVIQNHCKNRMKMHISIHGMNHSASTCLLTNLKFLMWKWASLRRWDLNGLEVKTHAKNDPKSINNWCVNYINYKIAFQIDFWSILERILEAFSVPKRMKLVLISVGHAPLKIAVDGGRVRQRCNPPPPPGTKKTGTDLV